MKLNPMTACDFYKVSHKNQYPEGTTLIYSNFTPRSNRLATKVGNNTIRERVNKSLQKYL